MTRYSIEHGDRIFVKRYGFFSGTKKISKNISKNVSDPAKESPSNAFNTISKKLIQTKLEATCDFIGNKMAETLERKHNKIIQRLSQKQKKNQ